MGVYSGARVQSETDYVYHICTVSGVFTTQFTGTVEVLVVAGGGGGGMDMGGGGGGGGVLSSTTYSVTAGSPITVTVGAGGAGAPAGGPPLNPRFHAFTVSATNGGNSVFGSLTAVGGGYGGSSYFGYTPNNGYGNSGGSGGGASGYSDGNTGRNGAGTAGQGFAGGTSIGQYYSGGGGGAANNGSNGGTPNGGPGVLNNILGRNYYWGGGGGGASYSSGVGGNGGTGGGGGGSSGGLGDTTGYFPAKNAGTGGGGDWVNTPGGDGGKHTGGGGGGSMHYNSGNAGGSGGSGIVIIRHLKTSGTSIFNGRNASPISALIFSMDAANVGKGSSVEVLVVGGGGGGGMDMGAGGGGGQAFVDNYSVQTNVGIPVTIGGAGAGSPGQYGNFPAAGSMGGTTRFGAASAIGGGGGGSGHYIDNYLGQQGQDGGNAGGDPPNWGRNRGQGQLSSYGGYGGGAAGTNGDGSYTAGGGGGASRPGAGGRGSWRAGDGGSGLLSAITGTSYYWGGGGGGAGHTNTAGGGGVGGGGGGSAYPGGGTAGGGGAGYNSGASGTVGVSANGGAGGTNTGGGGGGGSHATSVGGNGGSGIVIVRYYGSQKATGGTVSTAGSYTVHTFTSSGTFTPTEWIGARDLSETDSTVLVNGTTYSSDNGGSYTFNGSSTHISAGAFTGVTNFTVEIWFKSSDVSNYRNPIDCNWLRFNGTYSNIGPRLEQNSSGNLVWTFGDTSGNYENRTVVSSGLAQSVYHHTCLTKSGSTFTSFYNGVAVQTGAASYSWPGDFNDVQIGRGFSTSGERWFSGSIPLVKLYNRALISEEVLQNFYASRGRFGI